MRKRAGWLTTTDANKPLPFSIDEKGKLECMECGKSFADREKFIDHRCAAKAAAPKAE